MLKKADSVGQGTHPEYIGHYQKLETILHEVLCQKDCLSVRALALGGRELMALGLTGRAIGEMQRRMLDFVLEDPKRNTPETLTDFVRQHMEEL